MLGNVEESLELAQFPVTARMGLREADLRAPARGPCDREEGEVCEADLLACQVSSRGDECNLARFGSPEPGLKKSRISTTLYTYKFQTLKGKNH